MKNRLFTIAVLLCFSMVIFAAKPTPKFSPTPKPTATSTPTPFDTPVPTPTPVTTEPVVSPPSGELVWSDEFDGATLNTADWTYDIGTGPYNDGWGNNEVQYYTDREENVRLENGALVIEALKERYETKSYTSARIKTKDKQMWKYGTMEARIKLPEGAGLWPAFWMLGSSFIDSNWPYCGEIDIMETFGTDVVYGTVHWWADDVDRYAMYGNTTTTSVTDYHVYKVTWNDTSITWFIDDVQFSEIDITPPALSEFHQPYFILLNMAIGGASGNGFRKLTFPQTMYVDYVRVYQ
ncbi:MAG: glycoside hydrolase family 16 protein [Spirochaetales bacterium]|nr:glycoside hydrolase family 16 protein [Spirochaetales bacterium]